MSDHTILARFCKCGDLHNLSRRFHALTRTAKRHALDLIAAGVEPAKAIRRAKAAERREASRQPELFC